MQCHHGPPNEVLVRQLQQLLPDLPESKAWAVLEQNNFIVEAAADMLFTDNGSRAGSPDKHSSSDRPHWPDAQHQVPTPDNHPDLFPKELATPNDDYGVVGHKNAFSSDPVHQSLDVQLQSCPEHCVHQRGKSRHWWRKQGAQELHVVPPCGVYSDDYYQFTKSPTKLAHSAIPGMLGNSCVGLDTWPEQKSSSSGYPQGFEFLNRIPALATSHDSAALTHSKVAHDLSQVKISETPAHLQGSQPHWLDDATLGNSQRSVPLERDWLEPSASSHPPEKWQRATVFAGDDYPEDALKKLQNLKQIFCMLPDGLIENNLRETGYDLEKASESCFALLSMEHGVATGDWSDSSEADSASIVPDCLDQPESPQSSGRHWPPDESESLQVHHILYMPYVVQVFHVLVIICA